MTGEILAAAVPAALITIVAWRRPWRRRDEQVVAMEAWLESFSPESYLPMLRLAESLDTGFLTAQRGPEEAARYRRLQRQILKEYLRGLSRDFHRLHSLATESALRARHDHENSSLALVEEKMEFAFSMWSVDIRLMVNDFAPCAVNLRPLIANVDELTARVREANRRRLEFRVS
jgi:hypothetical protein